jgi:hypothetical protein
MATSGTATGIHYVYSDQTVDYSGLQIGFTNIQKYTTETAVDTSFLISSIEFSYNGSTALPVNAGTYKVTFTGLSGESCTANLNISKVSPVIVFDTESLSQIYNNTPRPIIVSASVPRAKSLLTNNIVAYWPLASGVDDISGNNNDLLTVGNPTFQSNGASVSDGNFFRTGLAVQGEWSVSFWYSATSFANPQLYPVPISVGDGMTGYSAVISTTKSNTANTSMNFGAGPAPVIGGGNPKYYFTGSQTPLIALGTLYNIVIIASSTSIAVYRNGSLLKTFSSSESKSFTGVILGNNIAGTGAVTGKFSNVALWNRALSPSSVSEVYLNGNNSLYAGDQIGQYLVADVTYGTANSSTAPTTFGVYNVSVRVAESSNTTLKNEFRQLTIAKATGVTISAQAKANVNYDGGAKVVKDLIEIVTSVPCNVDTVFYSVNYVNGAIVGMGSAYSFVPNQPGTYGVVCTINDPNVTAAGTGSVSFYFTFERGPAPAINFSSLLQTYNGSPKSVLVTTDPAGYGYNVVYKIGSTTSSTPPTNVGSYEVVATIDDIRSVAASKTETLVIAPAPASDTIALNNLDVVYDGLPKPVEAVSNPSGLNIQIVYDYPNNTQSSTPPTSAGSYLVTASVYNNPNYRITATATLVIRKAKAGVALSGPTTASYNGSAKGVLFATTPTGLSYTVAYRDSTDTSNISPVNVGTYTAVATIVDQNGNYEGTSNSVSFEITKANFTITLGGLNQIYDGAAKLATATTSPSGVPVTITYNGSSSPPVAVGAYAIVATGGGGNYNTSTVNSVMVILAPVVPTTPGGTGSGSSTTGTSLTVLASIEYTSISFGNIISVDMLSLEASGGPFFVKAGDDSVFRVIFNGFVKGANKVLSDLPVVSMQMVMKAYDSGEIIAKSKSFSHPAGEVPYMLFVPMNSSALFAALSDVSKDTGSSLKALAEIQIKMNNPYYNQTGATYLMTSTKTFEVQVTMPIGDLSTYPTSYIWNP